MRCSPLFFGRRRWVISTPCWAWYCVNPTNYEAKLTISAAFALIGPDSEANRTIRCASRIMMLICFINPAIHCKTLKIMRPALLLMKFTEVTSPHCTFSPRLLFPTTLHLFASVVSSLYTNLFATVASSLHTTPFRLDNRFPPFCVSSPSASPPTCTYNLKPNMI
jgi:hypothetical protein